jgi:DNA helicase-2/ATP-dependent DNA helicase PcrA
MSAFTDTPPAPLWSAGLNDAQRAAVDHDGGPLLVVAGAGTGKTRTVVARVARLIDDGARPDRMLLVTFSRRAADEVVRRVGELTEAAAARQLWAGTFHAVGHRLLRRFDGLVGRDGTWSVLDAADTVELFGVVRAELVAARQAAGLPKRRFPRAATLASLYSRVVNAGRPLAEVLAEDAAWCAEERDGIAEVFRAYTSRKRVGGLVDFDDLLLYWRAAVADPVAGPAMAAMWDHVLVDEYQDTNRVQADILAGLCAGGAQLTVVGDDAQAIYGFRAATVGNLLEFPDRFPDATKVVLEQSYRSTQPVLDLANAVLDDMGGGWYKQLWTATVGGRRPVLATCPDEAAQADAVCDTVLAHLEAGVALRDQAILARAAHHTDLIELELGRRRIPFVKYGGLRFVEAAHVRDLAACLRVLEHPWDALAWPRVLGLLDGVGSATTTRLLDELGVTDPHRSRDPLAVFTGPDRPRIRADAAQLDALVAALADCRDGRLGVGAQLDRLVLALGPLIRARYEHGEVRVRDLAALARSTPPEQTRAGLLAELALHAPASTSDLAGAPTVDEDWITVSTVHSAKGGEWRAVHVINASDGMFPSDLATGSREGVDEERRLFYVALTRARDHLHVYAPLRYHHGGTRSRGDTHSWAQRTRFLPPAVDHLLDHRPVRSVPADVAAVTADPVTAAVDDLLGSLW